MSAIVLLIMIRIRHKLKVMRKDPTIKLISEQILLFNEVIRWYWYIVVQLMVYVCSWLPNLAI
jgi:hypothetical protein